MWRDRIGLKFFLDFSTVKKYGLGGEGHWRPLLFVGSLEVGLLEITLVEIEAIVDKCHQGLRQLTSCFRQLFQTEKALKISKNGQIFSFKSIYLSGFQRLLIVTRWLMTLFSSESKSGMPYLMSSKVHCPRRLDCDSFLLL